MGWLRQLKESYWQPSQVDLLDNKLEPLRLNDTSAAQLSPIERFVEVERDLGRLTLVTQALIEACVRKGLLTHAELTGIIGDVDLSLPEDSRWGAAATERPSLPLALSSNGHATSTASPAGAVGTVDDFGNANGWGSDDEPLALENESALASNEVGFDFGGGEIDANSAIEVGGDSTTDGGVATIPRTAPFPKPKRRQQSSAVRQIVGMGLSGVIGLGIGYFILLWFTGQDIIKAAPMLPKWMVPAEFHAKAAPNTPSMKDDPAASFPLGGDLAQSKDFGAIQGAGQNGGNINGRKGKEAIPPLDGGFETLEDPNAGIGDASEPTGFLDPADDPLAQPSVSIAPPSFNPNPPQATPNVTAPNVTAPNATGEPDSEEPGIEPGTGEPAGAAPTTTEPGTTEPGAAEAGLSVPMPNVKPGTDEVASAEPTTPVAKEPEAGSEPKQFVVKDGMAVDGETLGAKIADANRSSIDLKTGELTDDSAKKAKVAAFQKFCEMAKAVTFVDGEPAKDDLVRRKLSAEGAARLAVEDEATFKDVAEIAYQWIFKLPANRRPTSGVLLTGIVKAVQPAGELKIAMVDLGDARFVNVVVAKDADVLETDRIAVLGVIVEQPVENLRGYVGPEEKAVWSEHVIKAEAPITPLE
jgi:hypothetical protein